MSVSFLRQTSAILRRCLSDSAKSELEMVIFIESFVLFSDKAKPNDYKAQDLFHYSAYTFYDVDVELLTQRAKIPQATTKKPDTPRDTVPPAPKPEKKN